MTLQPGTRLGHYEIASLLGSGGMGEVYRAKDHKLGRDVAIKVLREELATDPERLRRFEQEARSASALNHPNIITIHDIRLRHSSAEKGYGGQVGPQEDVDFIVMEFVEGKTLREMLSEGSITTKKLLQLATQIAEGLSKAHSAGLIHRDLKPENLMVTSDGYVKILDFGLAKLRAPLHDTDSDVAAMTKEGTAQGTVMGTVGYMSPEQAKGQSADFRSDQFSFGAILYEMVTGQRAFRRDSSVQTLSAIIEQEPEPIATLHPETPPHLRLTVERCMAKNPEERYDSTRDLARELKSIPEVATPPPSEPIAAPSEMRRLWPSIVVIGGGMAAILALALALNVGGMRDWLTGERSAPHINSIAVLPLENLSGDPDQEYFADGMTEAVINELAQIRALKVISRTSVMQYKSVRRSLPEIAEELDVQAVVEGSIVRAGNRVAITAQLIDASSDEHLWSRSYEREMKDILTLRKEVARAIAQEIQVELTSLEETSLSQVQTVNADAYDAYLRGRYFFGRMFPEDLRKAIQYYEEAIAIDPGFAPAFAGLAEVYSRQGSLFVLPPQEAFAKCRANAEKALELDGSLAEAHVALAWAKCVGEWDWSGSEEAFLRALELNDGYALTHLWYGWFLMVMGRNEEGLFELQKALELDPVSQSANIIVAYGYYLARRYDHMLEHCKRTVELDPTFVMGHGCLAHAYRQKSMHKESIATMQEAIRIGGRQTNFLVHLGWSYAAAGEKTEALKIIDEVKQLRNQTYIDPGLIGFIYVYLGDADEAIRWLEKAYEEHGYSLLWAKAPLFDSLRADPRFQDLLQRMNFPE